MQTQLPPDRVVKTPVLQLVQVVGDEHYKQFDSVFEQATQEVQLVEGSSVVPEGHMHVDDPESTKPLAVSQDEQTVELEQAVHPTGQATQLEPDM